MKRNSKIVKYKKPFTINIGVIVFSIIFIYLMICLIQYLTSEPVSPYEVEAGTIAQNNTYTGFAIRSEEIIYAPKSGYINYYSKEGSKIGARSLVYSLSDSPNVFEAMNSNGESKLTTDDYDSLTLSLNNFCYDFDDSRFYQTEDYRESLTQEMVDCLTYTDDGTIDTKQLNINKKESPVSLYYAKEPGVVCYSLDGYEDIRLSSFTADLLDESRYSKSNLSKKERINENEPVYKVITGEEWQLIVPISDKEEALLKKDDYLKITFKEDDRSVWAGSSVKKINGKIYLILSLNNSMIRYSSQRYIDIQFSLNPAVGLKIPNSAKVNRSFYIVPKSYLTKGGNSNSSGVLFINKKGETEFTEVSVFKVEDTNAYISSQKLSLNSKLKEPEGVNNYVISQEKELLGVYNINRGYAVFRQIKCLAQNEDYSIIEENTSYGISIYDHIALDAASVLEGDIINEK